jgi:CelD/BcsL family acetyltransferase involved in cellulose biosynthesis
MLSQSLKNAYHSTSLHVDVRGWQEWSTFASAWAGLVDRSPHATFFVSSDWIETWLESFGAGLNPALLVFRNHEQIVGMCFLVRRTERKGPFTIRRVYLNTSGEDDADSPCTEFQTLLCEPGHEAGVAEALRDYLEELRVREPWDELAFTAVVDSPALAALAESFAPFHEIDQPRPSYYVELDAVRASGKDYLTSLASRMRTQFRHSEKRYAELGALTLDVAQTAEQAQLMLSELAVLHQASWEERGAPGSFASPVFFHFHRRLIDRCFDRGHIQLLMVRAGDTPIGGLYNHVYRGRVYFYQSGFNYALDKRLSPGLVVQVLAIRHAAASGLAQYDLMAGDSDYKRKLASKHNDLHWLVWRAPGLKMRAFDALRGTKHWVEQRPLAEVKSLMATFRSRLAARS